MAFALFDRVRDTSVTTGTGVFTVTGTAPNAYRTFSSVLSTNDTFPAFIAHQTANEWEVGIYTYSGVNQITRTTITASSNGGAAVNFSAGTKDVVLTNGGAGAIAFPATQVTSSNANILDDYEEGTWTPAVTFATPGDLNAVQSATSGAYTKIGNKVLFGAVVQTSTFTFTTASSFFEISGLPFACASQFVGAGSIVMKGYTKAGFHNLQMETSNTTFVYVVAAGSGVVFTELVATDFTTGTLVGFYATGQYNA